MAVFNTAFNHYKASAKYHKKNIRNYLLCCVVFHQHLEGNSSHPTKFLHFYLRKILVCPVADCRWHVNTFICIYFCYHGMIIECHHHRVLTGMEGKWLLGNVFWATVWQNHKISSAASHFAVIISDWPVAFKKYRFNNIVSWVRQFWCVFNSSCYSLCFCRHMVQLTKSSGKGCCHHKCK